MKKRNLFMPTVSKLPTQLMGWPNDPSIKNDEQNLFTPRGRSSSEPNFNIQENQNGNSFQESRIRFSSVSSCVRFQVESEDGSSVQRSISEQSKTCEKYKRWDSEYKEMARENESQTNYGFQDNKGHSDEFCVEMKEAAYKEDDNETNRSQDTAFWEKNGAAKACDTLNSSILSLWYTVQHLLLMRRAACVKVWTPFLFFELHACVLMHSYFSLTSSHSHFRF